MMSRVFPAASTLRLLTSITRGVSCGGMMNGTGTGPATIQLLKQPLTSCAEHFYLSSPTIAKADDQQLVEDYLKARGALGAVVRPITDDYVGRTFPNLSFFGVIFRQVSGRRAMPTDAGPEVLERLLCQRRAG